MMRPPAIVLICSLLVAAQTTPPSIPDLQAHPSDLTIRISVDLVQVDAVVTDSKNHPVTDLKAGDFEILQDGVPQTVTNFSYVHAAGAPTSPQALSNGPAPPRELKPQEVRRVLALVVDDLGLSFESIAYVQIALKKFVDEQMRPGDLVAILRTGAGIGALQQFTSDKRLLYAAIDRVRFNPLGRVGISSFEPFQSLNTPGGPNSPTASGAAGGRGIGDAVADRSISAIYAAGSLGAVRYVAQGLKDLPGRKSVVLFSENMPMSVDPVITESLHRLTDAAERSAVVIYTIDPRGLGGAHFSAADQTAGLSVEEMTSALIGRSQDYRSTQDEMSFLAHETGGLFIHDLNDLSGSIQRVLDDSSSYYLIGYHPAPGTFDPSSGHWQFHQTKVRVRRAGLQVRTRGGFFGLSDRQVEPPPANREAQLSRALESPFSASDIHLRLTTLFSPQANGSFITTLLHAEAKDIMFNHTTDGSYRASVDVVAALFGDNGQVIASGIRTYKLRVREQDYDTVLRNGFIFTEQHLVKQPGAYQIRLVLRDAALQRLGSASQFIEIPDMKKRRLALSGILLRNSPELAASSVSATDSQTEASDARGNAAVRIFRPGAKISYSYEVLNARHEPETPPDILEQVRLFRDGKQFYEGAPARLDFHGQTDLLHLATRGIIRLGPAFAPGDYVMQVVVTDKLARKARYRSTSQWMDFEVE